MMSKAICLSRLTIHESHIMFLPYFLIARGREIAQAHQECAQISLSIPTLRISPTASVFEIYPSSTKDPTA
jgi:hypothetical protein